jgi:hypothetical protein
MKRIVVWFTEGLNQVFKIKVWQLYMFILGIVGLSLVCVFVLDNIISALCGIVLSIIFSIIFIASAHYIAKYNATLTQP